MAFTTRSLHLTDQFTCPSCKNIYIDPIRLSCNHAMCYSCYREKYQRTRVVNCPKCNQDTSTEPQCLPKEHYLELCIAMWSGQSLARSNGGFAHASSSNDDNTLTLCDKDFEKRLLQVLIKLGINFSYENKTNRGNNTVSVLELVNQRREDIRELVNENDGSLVERLKEIKLEAEDITLETEKVVQELEKLASIIADKITDIKTRSNQSLQELQSQIKEIKKMRRMLIKKDEELVLSRKDFSQNTKPLMIEIKELVEKTKLLSEHRYPSFHVFTPPDFDKLLEQSESQIMKVCVMDQHKMSHRNINVKPLKILCMSFCTNTDGLYYNPKNADICSTNFVHYDKREQPLPETVILCSVESDVDRLLVFDLNFQYISQINLQRLNKVGHVIIFTCDSESQSLFVANEKFYRVDMVCDRIVPLNGNNIVNLLCVKDKTNKANRRLFVHSNEHKCLKLENPRRCEDEVQKSSVRIFQVTNDKCDMKYKNNISCVDIAANYNQLFCLLPSDKKVEVFDLSTRQSSIILNDKYSIPLDECVIGDIVTELCYVEERLIIKDKSGQLFQINVDEESDLTPFRLQRVVDIDKTVRVNSDFKHIAFTSSGVKDVLAYCELSGQRVTLLYNILQSFN